MTSFSDSEDGLRVVAGAAQGPGDYHGTMSKAELEREAGGKVFTGNNAQVERTRYQGAVVAEGAEEGLINPNEKITQVEKRDGSNNLIYDDIGNFMQSAVKEYAETEHNMQVNVAAIDPTYAIRSVPANAGDTQLCTQLA